MYQSVTGLPGATVVVARNAIHNERVREKYGIQITDGMSIKNISIIMFFLP
jgi:hypothetical protein